MKTQNRTMLSNSSIILIEIILSITAANAKDATAASFPDITRLIAVAAETSREQVERSSTRVTSDAPKSLAALSDSSTTMNCKESPTSGTKCVGPEYNTTPLFQAPDKLKDPSINILLSDETTSNSKETLTPGTKREQRETTATTFFSLLQDGEENRKITSEMLMNRFKEGTEGWTIGAITASSTRMIEGRRTTDACNMNVECFQVYVEEKNVTDSNYTNSSSRNEDSKPSEVTPLWRVIFDDIQVIFILIGTLTNLFTVITLFLNNAGFSRVILTLLHHQALVDVFVCAMASTLILQPYHWLTGFYYFDVVVCYAWHSQALYWGGVTASTYNLILVAYERYLAVCKPFRHSEMSAWSRTTFAKIFLALYVLTLIITHGCYIQTRLTEDECLNEYAFDGPSIHSYFFFFVIFTYLTTYLIPALLMGLCYGLVIRQLKLRNSDRSLGRSKRLDRANDQLTKTAIAVTIVFICTLGYDLHYYLLGYTGVAVYELNTPIQKVGVFLSNINSSVTPFVYAAVMPIFRRSVTQTLCCRRNGKKDARGSQHSSVWSSAVRENPPVPANPPRRGRLESWQSDHSATTTSGSRQSVAISVIEI